MISESIAFEPSIGAPSSESYMTPKIFITEKEKLNNSAQT